MPIKTKLVALGVGSFLTWLLWPKPAQAKSVVVRETPKTQDVVVDERPAAAEVPQAAPAPSPAPVKKPAGAKKPGGKKPAAPGTVVVEPTDAEAQAALDQAWPLIEGGRAQRDTLTAALRWAKQVGDTARADEIIKLLGGP